ncbi:MAG: F-box protein [Verrucomicrobia bacterium]|nr:F-box protein [Verrucomicrobiota bacterium]
MSISAPIMNDALPVNVLQGVFSYLDLGSLRSVSHVCKQWQETAQNLAQTQFRMALERICSNLPSYRYSRTIASLQGRTIPLSLIEIQKSAEEIIEELLQNLDGGMSFGLKDGEEIYSGYAPFVYIANCIAKGQFDASTYCTLLKNGEWDWAASIFEKIKGQRSDPDVVKKVCDLLFFTYRKDKTGLRYVDAQKNFISQDLLTDIFRKLIRESRSSSALEVMHFLGGNTLHYYKWADGMTRNELVVAAFEEKLNQGDLPGAELLVRQITSWSENRRCIQELCSQLFFKYDRLDEVIRLFRRYSTEVEPVLVNIYGFLLENGESERAESITPRENCCILQSDVDKAVKKAIDTCYEKKELRRIWCIQERLNEKTFDWTRFFEESLHAGELELAHGAVKKMRNGPPREEASSKLAENWIERGEVTGAEKLIRSIPEGANKWRVLGALAVHFSKEGKFQEANNNLLSIRNRLWREDAASQCQPFSLASGV